MLRRSGFRLCSKYGALNSELRDESAQKIMHKALSMFGNEIAISFSGAEDVVLVELAARTGLPYRVFSLDTGRLHPQTYKLFQEVEKAYNIHIEYTFPDAEATQNLVRTKGMFSFYEDGHQECCNVRKVDPLRKQLGGLKAWITGQRQDQSVTRTDVPVVHLDSAFKGAGENSELCKWNPLANMKGRDVWQMIRDNDIPFNALHLEGFVSIGCEPCTKPTLPNQHEREGRWWWEDQAVKECGLHKQKA